MIKRLSLTVWCFLFLLTLLTFHEPCQVLAAGSVKSLRNFAGEWVAAKQKLSEEPYLKLYCGGLQYRIMEYLYNNLDYWRQVQGKWKLLRVNQCTIDDNGVGVLDFTYQGSMLDGGGRIKWEVTRTFYLQTIDGRWKIVNWGERSERMLN